MIQRPEPAQLAAVRTHQNQSRKTGKKIIHTDKLTLVVNIISNSRLLLVVLALLRGQFRVV